MSSYELLCEFIPTFYSLWWNPGRDGRNIVQWSAQGDYFLATPSGHVVVDCFPTESQKLAIHERNGEIHVLLQHTAPEH